MNKKIFTLLFIAVFLLASISFVSAADSIPVKVIWDDSNQANERPDEIAVNLLCDGKIVDTAKLSASNSWKTTFKNLNDDGKYEVKIASQPAEYSIQTKGNEEDGFSIICNLMAETLGSAEDDASLEEGEVTQVTDDNAAEPAEADAADDTNATDNETATDAENATGDNATNDEELTDDVSDENDTADGAEVTSDKPTTVQKSPIKENNKKVKPVKKNNKPIKGNLKHTGIPLAGLVLVLFTVAFVPFSRKK